jgi:hypothetical protein
LFIQAPRTGCTAIAKLLFERFGGEQLPSEDILNDDGTFKVPRKHCTLAQVVDARLIDEREANTLCTFTSVRNPFDSLASMYVKKREKYQPLLADKASWIHRVPGYVDDMEFCRTHTFEEWLNRHYAVSRADRWLGRRQRSLSAKYTRGVKCVLRFERLQQDFEQVMRSVGIREDVKIPKFNATPTRKASYQSYYTPTARKLVEYVFKPDLERYGYSFDGLDETRAVEQPVGTAR